MSYVMIVDDDQDFTLAVAKVLGKAGHEVDICLTTENAGERMERQPPDLLILDVMFPESSSAGFELARWMCHFSKNLKNVPILMLTAVNAQFPFGFSSKDIDDRWLPVTDFLEKPVDLDVLLNRAAAIFSKQQQLTGSGSNANSGPKTDG